jgi:hypothetical protein
MVERGEWSRATHFIVARKQGVRQKRVRDKKYPSKALKRK